MAGSEKVKEQDTTNDLKRLPDDQFKKLLDELSTFNKPSNEESDLSKQLKKETADPLEDVNKNEPTWEATGRNRRSRHGGCFKGRSSQGLDGDVLNWRTSLFPNRTTDTTSKKKNSFGRCKEDLYTKGSALERGLGKAGFQSQSLQDLASTESIKNSNVGRNTQRHQKVQRASSFSSASLEETLHCALETDSFRTGVKSSKNKCAGLYHQVSSNELLCTKTENLIDDNATKVTEDLDSKCDNSNVNEATNICELLCSSLQASGKVIAMDKLSKSDCDQKALYVSKSNDEAKLKGTKGKSKISSDDQSDKVDSNHRQKYDCLKGNSKFYIDCTEVDTPVMFPLKMLSANGESNQIEIKSSYSDNFSKYPKEVTVSQFEVHHLTSPLIDKDFITSSKSETKQIDINGNQCSQVLCAPRDCIYPGGSALSELTLSKQSEFLNRKHKRIRNSTENHKIKCVLAEEIAGHRGTESIETLLEFINSSDKKNRVLAKNSTDSSTIAHFSSGNKFCLAEQTDRKDRSIGREIKSSYKKKMLNSGSSEGDTEEQDDLQLDVQDSITCKSIPVILNCVKSHSMNDETNSEQLIKKSTDSSFEYGSQNFSSPVPENVDAQINCNSPSENEPSNVSELSPSVFEDTGFRVVKKKQRKRHQSKRESHRWHSAAVRAGGNSGERDYYMHSESTHSSNIFLGGLPLSQRSQCGKQDSRRKSTSSMPPSEHSSADNSDLDSVHSLPVRGSVLHPTQPHPHTTPSSSSSTPQASYADIARMSISSSKNPSAVFQNSHNKINMPKESYEQSSSHLTLVTDFSMKPEENLLKSNTFSENTSISLAVEDMCQVSSSLSESFTFDCNDAVCSNNSTKNTREINTQTEPVTLSPSQLNCNIEDDDTIETQETSDNEKHEDHLHKATSTSTLNQQESSINSSLCMNEELDSVINGVKCPHNFLCIGQKNALNKNCRPAVVMRNYIPPNDVCEVSFGFNIEEVLNNCSNTSLNLCTENLAQDLKQCASLTSLDHSLNDTKDDVSDSQLSSVQIDANKNFPVDSSEQTECLNAQQNDKCLHGCHKASSLPEKLFVISGHPFHFQETEVNKDTFNYNQIVNFFGCAWNNVFQDYKEDGDILDDNNSDSKIRYYREC